MTMANAPWPSKTRPRCVWRVAFLAAMICLAQQPKQSIIYNALVPGSCSFPVEATHTPPRVVTHAAHGATQAGGMAAGATIANDAQGQPKPSGRRRGGRSGAGRNANLDIGTAADINSPIPLGEAISVQGSSPTVSRTHLSDQRFEDLSISAETKRAISEGFHYELMTMVQAATLGPMLSGADVVARARTGTGKTLAFLVPMIERISKDPGGAGGKISALVLSPTRELAQQIADEAQVLMKFHNKLGVACFYGGTNINKDQNTLREKPVDILIATPGRMQDHLDNTPGFKDRLKRLAFLALDEADQLLDMGFRDAIKKILQNLPAPTTRQGALFSATFPNAVGDIAKLALKSEHAIINTVSAEEEVTPDQIDQSVAITDLKGMTDALWAAVNSEVQRLPRDYKIMVFFTTARVTQLYSELFGAAGLKVLEVHSRKSQASRTKSTDQFRSAKSGIMFSSDVSARGMDFPGVTTVIQVGVPSSREQYIHRLGRTGRAGKSGKGILLLQDFEEFFLRSLKDLPLTRMLVTDFKDTPAPPAALWKPDPKTGGQAYQAWLGYYNSVKGLGMSKVELVRTAAQFAVSVGAAGPNGQPPPMLQKTVSKMGLKGVPGLNIVSVLPYAD